MSFFAILFAYKLCVCKNSSIYEPSFAYFDCKKRLALTSFYLLIGRIKATILSGHYLLFFGMFNLFRIFIEIFVASAKI